MVLFFRLLNGTLLSLLIAPLLVLAVVLHEELHAATEFITDDRINFEGCAEASYQCEWYDGWECRAAKKKLGMSVAEWCCQKYPSTETCGCIGIKMGAIK